MLALYPRDWNGDNPAASSSSPDGGSAAPPPPPGPPSRSKAHQACLSCRKQKRRCDKVLPACGLCARMSRACDYSDPAPPPPSHQQQPAGLAGDAAAGARLEELSALQMRVVELEQRLNQRDQQQQQNPNSLPSPDVTMGGTGSEPSSGVTPASVESGGGGGGRGHSEGGSGRGTGREYRERGDDLPGRLLWIRAPERVRKRFPASMFLDADAFRWASVPVPKPGVDIPLDVLEILNHGNAVQKAADEYFRTVHLWFPIVSQKRMNLGLPLWDGGADLAMLFLAMKLLTEPPVTETDPVDSPLYTAGKRFLALLESGGTVSILYLQSMVLVALYEMGHGIYPAAWMTVGACARYCDVLGLPLFKESTSILGQLGTWTEAEERRRASWAVFVLDRFISLGSKRRFAMPAPSPTESLPVDDAAWDEGDMARALHRAVASPLAALQGPFARLCQAAMLAGRAVEHCSAPARRLGVLTAHGLGLGAEGDSAVEAAARRDVDALVGDLEAFERIVTDEMATAMADAAAAADGDAGSSGHRSSDKARAAAAARLVAPQALARSALILVHDQYSCPESLREGPLHISDAVKTAVEVELQVRAVPGLRDVSLRVRDAGLDLLEAAVLPAGLNRASPLVLDALYCAMGTLHWLWKEGGEQPVYQGLEDVKQCLVRLSMRWRVAETYLAMDELHDITTNMAWRAATGN